MKLLDYSEKCYKFTRTNPLLEWQEFASIKDGSVSAAGNVYRNKFHIFGGRKLSFGHQCNSSEIISEDGGVEVGPDLPTGLFAHSITAISETTSILSGGFEDMYSQSSSKTWYYNHETKTFTSGPTLLEGRRFHGSATYVDRMTKEKIPVVTGGFNSELGILGSTELLKNGKWQKGTIHCMKRNV